MRSILVVSVVLAWAAPAGAQPKEDPDALFVQGRELLSKGDGAGACEKFHAVNRLKPDAPSVLLNLGLCYEAQDRIATALRWFRKASDKATEAVPQTDDTREFDAAARERRNALTPKVASIKIDLAATQADVVVAIDGERQNRNVLADAVEVDKGKHVIEATAPGMKTHVQEIEIANSEKGKPVAIPALEKAPIDVVGPPAKSRRNRGLVMLIGGAVVAGGAAVLAASLDSNGSLGSGEKYNTTGHVVMGGLGVVVVAGTAAAALGLYYVIKPNASQPERRVAITPVVTPSFGGVSLGGRF